ncbi:MAG: Transcriptional regulator, XRE family [uncultured Aureispira sp.]|jgi:transcriptional regulator with XRE-family HTH domain|uniref:Transcriptional regulator, XRE family n=1 Tax=uncultured Aureispira sp. TaxID=1331704 RepID=A0A6S6UGT0_9BACT|nr:MAG: Transcriptional regulator, XRE family [uncultured Aureispira sp.]
MKKNLISNAFNKVPKENKQFVSKNLDISQQVFAILEEKGWSQIDLARRLGKHKSDVSRMLSGLQNLTLKTITKLEAILETDIILTPIKAEQKFGTIKYVTLTVDVNKNDTSISKTPHDNSGMWKESIASPKKSA